MKKAMKKVGIVLVLAALVAGVAFAQKDRKIAFKPFYSGIKQEDRPKIVRVEETPTGAKIYWQNTTGKNLGYLWMAVRAFYSDGTDEFDTAYINITNVRVERTQNFKFRKPSDIQNMNVQFRDTEPDNMKR